MRVKYWITASAISVMSVGAGCTSELELHYGTYNAAGDSAKVMAAALNHEQLIPLTRTNIFLVPTATLTGSNVSADKPVDPTKPAPAAPAKKGGKGKGAKPAAGQPAANNQADATDKPDAQTSSMSKLVNPMNTAMIDNVSWSAIPVPVVDDTAYMTVTGTNTLFHTDTVAIGHPDNSDIVSSINSKAVNNTATLIGTAAGAVAAIAPLALAAAPLPKPEDVVEAAKQAQSAQLRPTWIRVGDTAVTDPAEIVEDQYWYYTLTWSPPPATVTPQQFIDYVKDKTVSVFPVPACITATLNVFQATGKSLPPPDAKPKATFVVTVETPNFIRPYDLPAVGMVTMGTVCGASSTDSSPSESDTTQEVVKALSSAATTINSAFNKKTSSNNTQGGATAAPAKTGD
jgi:hypothetical protein